ncbi:MAG: hypothetical protein QM733_15745 [Ilumatobacteraceae bacterium]
MMTPARNAAIRYDLLGLFTNRHRAEMPAGEDDDGSSEDDTSDESTDDTGDGGTPPPADEDTRDPRIKQLCDENAAHRHKNKELQKALDEATAQLTSLPETQAALVEARQHNAFLIAAFGRVDDLEAAWKLADRTTLTVNEDGTVTGAAELVDALCERYPYLVPPADTPYVPPPTEPSGRPANGRRFRRTDPNRTALENKFPALRGRK